MSLKRAKEYLKEFGFEDRVMEFPISSKTVREAAIAIGCGEEEIGKTLSFLVGDKPILIVVAGTSKIDNHKYKEEFSVKAKMVPVEMLSEIIGHEAGGVCPFGINNGVEVYLDKSLKRLENVYPACGSSNSGVKLTVDELERISNIKGWVDVCKDM